MSRGEGSYIRVSDKETVSKIDFCVYCGSDKSLSIDHISPPKKGGNSVLQNLTRACKSCNSAKGDFPIEVFLQKTIQKRDIVFNKLFTYTTYLRLYKNGISARYDKGWLIKKIKECRETHSRLTKIINSILTEKYRLFN
jgi:hypothetical protein